MEEYEVDYPENREIFSLKSTPNVDDDEPVEVLYFDGHEFITMIAKDVEWSKVKSWRTICS